MLSKMEHLCLLVFIRFLRNGVFNKVKCVYRNDPKFSDR